MTARFPTALAAISAGGLALRLAWILLGDWSPDRLIGDAGFYHAVANLLADGHGFSVPGDPAHPPTAAYPPLHPLVLSLPSLLGLTGWTAHRLVGALLGAVTVALVGLLGRRVGGERAGIAAAAIAAVYPVFIRIDGTVMSETLYGLLIAATLLAALRLIERPRGIAALALGALIGLAALTRSEAVLLLPLLAAPVAIRAGGRRARNLALACAACALLLAPWTIRNLSAFDAFVPASSNSGTALAGANCDRTYSGVDLGFWRFACAGGGGPGDEVEQSAALRSRALEYARDHAGRLPLVVPVRVLRTWDLYQPLRQGEFTEGGHITLHRFGLAAYYLLAALAVAGALRLRDRRAELLVLVAPVLLVTIVAALTLGAPRLRFAAEIPLVVLAAVAVSLARPSARAG